MPATGLTFARVKAVPQLVVAYGDEETEISGQRFVLGDILELKDQKKVTGQSRANRNESKAEWFTLSCFIWLRQSFRMRLA